MAYTYLLVSLMFLLASYGIHIGYNYIYFKISIYAQSYIAITQFLGHEQSFSATVQ